MKKLKQSIIAIDAADLCYERVDGTRVYIKNVLDNLGKIDKFNKFIVYLKGEVNKELLFEKFKNYLVRKSFFPFFWTQLKFPFELFRDRPDVLWMPLQTIPFFLPRKTKVIVTIHDLAFNLFSNHFTYKDSFLLKFFTKYAIQRADKIIAVSENTKKDIIDQYNVNENKIKVIYHGYDNEIFNIKNSRNIKKIESIKKKYKISGEYILYAGAIQPRKNLLLLVQAFEKLKTENKNDPNIRNIKLVIAGSKAWLYKSLFNKIKLSKFREDIIFSGYYKTEEPPGLMGGSKMFVFPSLYEGFGMPILEAFASGVPVITAKNSSLKEIGKGAALLFEAEKSDDLKDKMKEVLLNKTLFKDLIDKGLMKSKEFSWNKCVTELLIEMNKLKNQA